jgi:hypothetical protein
MQPDLIGSFVDAYVQALHDQNAEDGLTKAFGPNPLQYVGVTFSASGTTATFWEKIGDSWVEFDKIDGSASYQVQVNREYRGNGYSLGGWYSTYDWVADNGFSHFANWVA